MKSTPRFSLRQLMCLVAMVAVLLALNLRAAVETGELSTTLHDPSGAWGPMHDTISLERGFPFHFQQSRELFQHQTVTDEFVAAWRQSIGIRVTHGHWLVVNVVCAFMIAAVSAWGLTRLSGRTSSFTAQKC